MGELSVNQENIISLMKSLNVRIRKAEEERDCALQRLQKLKSILDCHIHKPRVESTRHVSKCFRPGSAEVEKTPNQNKTITDTELRPVGDRAHDSGLASSPRSVSDKKQMTKPETDRSSTSSENGDLCSLKFATAISDPVLRTPIRVVSRKQFMHTTDVTTKYHLPHMIHNRWSSLKPFSSDAPITSAPGVVETTTALSNPQISQSQSINQQTTSTAELRHQATVDDQYLMQLERECQHKAEQLAATQATVGIVSHTWLRRLISRLEELSNTYQFRHVIQTPTVRFQSDQCIPLQAELRSSSYSPTRTQSMLRRQSLTAQRSQSPPLRSSDPPFGQVQSPAKSRGRKSSKSGRIDYPVFVPIDHVSHKRSSAKVKPSTPVIQNRRTASAKATYTRAIYSPKLSGYRKPEPRNLSAVAKRAPSKNKKCRLPSVERRINTVRTAANTELPDRLSPRILITDPSGTLREMNSRQLSPVRTYKVRDRLMPEPVSRVSWR